MEGFKQCANGHYFKNNMSECPYCPKQNAGSASPGSPFDKTQISGGESGGGYSDNSKTQISGSGDFGSTQVFGAGAASGAKRDLSKTFIQESEVTSDGTVSSNTIRPSRKICGWIVSFTIEPMGIDFRIYEGVNTIGRDAENTITITDDMAISGRHVSILCKKGKFYIKDEMAANGSFVNNEELEVGKPTELQDGDEIKLGTTVFKFRTSF